MPRAFDEQASPSMEARAVKSHPSPHSRSPSSSHHETPKPRTETTFFLTPMHYSPTIETPSPKSPVTRPRRRTPVSKHGTSRKYIQQTKRPRQTTPSPSHDHQVLSYDGTLGSSYESRVTSKTWSSLSHRLFTDSTGSSQGLEAFEAFEQYNHLASMNGIREMQKCPGDTRYDEKTTRKVHHNGWLARKLFRRSSSTFMLEVKASQKPVARKISLGKLPKLVDGERRSILHDKSLEEMSRLGGLGLLTLPPQFALDKLTLPTCLAAVATYLFQHGRNTPGLFRLSGQSSVVNELYDFYAYQFSQAGSPSKVKETVGSCQIPTHIECSIHDAASFFKKVLISLPGGLLGSLELFEALRNVFFDLNPDTQLGHTDINETRSRLVALAISSSTSQYRVYLIQAVLGLVAYLGHEAEQARAEPPSPTTEGSQRNKSSELMGFQSLGVVLGPLLLGSLMDGVEIASENQESGPRTSTESAGKATKRPKRSSLNGKLDRDAALTAHIDRANLSANVMETLLTIWRDVVVQLRHIHSLANTSAPHDSHSGLKRTSNMTASRLNLRSPEEDLLFMNVLRGGKVPQYSQGQVKSKRKVRISSRSPITRRTRSISSNRSSGALTAEPGEVHGDSKERNPGITEEVTDIPKSKDPEAAPATNQGLTESPNSSHSSQKQAKRSHSEIAMDQMSMGTILPKLQDDPVTPLHKELLRPVRRPPTALSGGDDVSSTGNPQTTIRGVPATGKAETRAVEPLLDKPLPEIGDAQLAERSSPLTEDEEPPAATKSFPARESSLPTKKSLPLRPNKTVSESSDGRITKGFWRQSASELESRRLSGTTTGSTSSTNDSDSGSIRLLTQKFAKASRANRKAQEKEKGILKIFARIEDLQAPKTPTTDKSDPFMSSPRQSPPRNTLIPRPVQDVGSARKTLDRSPSPPKQRPVKKSSSNSLLTAPRGSQHGADTLVPWGNEPLRKISLSPSTSRTFSPDQADANFDQFRMNSGTFLEVAPTRPLSAYSSQSLRRIKLEEDPPVASHVSNTHSRVISLDVDARSDQVKMALHDSGLLNPETISLQRTGSINTTLVAEITRLKRLLEQKTAELDSAKRSLDAVRDAREAIQPDSSAIFEGNRDDDSAPQTIASTASGMRSVKGTLSEEVRMLRKERNEWKRRAEWAESRLAALESRDQRGVGIWKDIREE